MRCGRNMSAYILWAKLFGAVRTKATAETGLSPGAGAQTTILIIMLAILCYKYEVVLYFFSISSDAGGTNAAGKHTGSVVRAVERPSIGGLFHLSYSQLVNGRV